MEKKRFDEIKRASESEAIRLGYGVNPHLPSLEGVSLCRNIDEVANRALALHAAICVSFGCASEMADSWLRNNGLMRYLTENERRFIECPSDEQCRLYSPKVEALWVLMWGLKKATSLDFGKYCEDSLITLLPDILKNEAIDAWKNSVSLRSEDEVVSMCDLAYRLHWAIADELIHGSEKERAVWRYVIIERRHALEWLLNKCEWDDVPMDT